MKKIWKPQKLKKQPNQEMKQFHYNGFTLTYQQFYPGKDKTTIVFLYGFGGNIEYLRDASPIISNNSKYSVLTFDYPGHGYSSDECPFDNEKLVDYCIALLDYLHIDKFILVGYSFGGAIAMKLYQKTKSRVEKLILLYCDFNFTYNFFKKCFYFSFGQMLTLGLNFALCKVALPLLSDKYMSDAYYIESQDVIKFNKLSHVKAFYNQIIWNNYEYLLKAIDCPTFIIGSKCDFLISIKRYKHLHSLIPNSTLYISKDIGHLCVVTNPQEIARLILAWLK